MPIRPHQSAMPWLLLSCLAAGCFADDIGRDSTEPLAPVTTDQAMSVTAQLGAIDGQPVFTNDVLLPIESDLQRMARVAPSLSTFKAEAREAITKQVKSLVGDMIMVKAAKDALTEEDQKRVDFFMNKIRNDIITEHGGSVASVEQYFRARGSSFDKELSDRKRRLTIELYLRRKLYPRIQVTRSMVLNRYNKDVATKYSSEAMVDMYTITIPFTKFLKEPDPEDADGKRMRTMLHPTDAQIAAARAAALAEANEVENKIAQKVDFAQLAEDYSYDPQRLKGGRWKDTTRGSLLLKEVEDLAFSLPPHSLAKPLVVNGDERRGVVVIVKVEDVTPAKIVPFSEAQVAIDRQLRDEQYAKLSREYYAQLYAQSAIESADDMIDTAVDVAISRYAMK